MIDAQHLFGDDLTIATSGDLATSDGSEVVTERVYRRLMTPLRAYIWNLSYGSGLPEMVGSPISQQQIQGIVSEQMALEAAVDQTQPITVTVNSDAIGGVSLGISYTDAATGKAAGIALS